MQTPPNRLRELRLASGLKIYDVAARIRRTTATIEHWERGETTVPDRMKFALAELYEVTPSYLMGWDEAKIAS